MKRVNIKYLVVSLILVLSFLIGTSCSFGCSLPPIDTLPSSNPPATAIDPNWLPPPIESNAPELTSFITVVDKVKPSVVAINTIIYDVFNRLQEGAGSGWIIDEDGLIVTNNHVVEGAESITVTLDDGGTFPAGIVGTDRLTDLAVLKIDAENLVKASRGDSDELEVGEWVLAIGNSLNLGVIPSQGIISSLGASITVSPGQILHDLIRTSAPINPGNSGGPLVNMRGQVVGITSIKIAMVGVEAMGWAMSINSAMPIITQLINNGYVVRPYLGVVFCDVDRWPATRYKLAVDYGAFITEVFPGSPAHKEARLKVGDVIVSFEGKKISTAQELVEAIHACQIGREVKIIFWRGNTRHTVYATLIESSPPS